jgi:signal transduction histidine kinase
VNAIKCSFPNSAVDLGLFCCNRRAVIYIKDQGIGIPEEDQRYMFDAFQRASKVGSIPGTGLGLAIVRQAIQAHGGSITLKSEVGIGTTFTIHLPLGS